MEHIWDLWADACSGSARCMYLSCSHISPTVAPGERAAFSQQRRPHVGLQQQEPHGGKRHLNNTGDGKNKFLEGGAKKNMSGGYCRAISMSPTPEVKAGWSLGRGDQGRLQHPHCAPPTQRAQGHGTALPCASVSPSKRLGNPFQVLCRKGEPVRGNEVWK